MFKKNSDFSTSIEQDFRPDLITQEGITGPISAMAYDPTQGLFAVGTETGLVHVMGRGEVRAIFDPNPKRKTASSPIKFLRFLLSVYLVSIDERSMVVVWALDTRTEWSRYQSPYSVLSCWTDPAMDWLFIGSMTGETTAYDVDRGTMTPFKIPYLERDINPKSLMAAVRSVQLHPRDPALIMLCYHSVAVVYNLLKGEVVFSVMYDFPMTTAVWHPSGSHIATAHVNGFIVFWDGSKGVRLGGRNAFPATLESMDLGRDRIPEGLAWCCREDPTDTFLVAWGGNSVGLHDFGPTPVVAATSYEGMGDFFKSDKHVVRDLRLTADIKVAQVTAQNGQPHFQGCFNPQYIVFYAGEQFLCVTLPALQINPFDSMVLPPALCWRASRITSLTTTAITRNQWVGMMAAALPNTKVFGGTSATQKLLRRPPMSTVLCVGFANGAVKLFDATRADAHDYRVVMTSVANLDPLEANARVRHVSVGREVGELAVATEPGNVFLCSFGKNRRPTRPLPPTPSPQIVNIEHLVDAHLSQGFIPHFHYKNNRPVSALCNSNVGFVAIGMETGDLVVIDKRGPAVIMDEKIKGVATVLEFGIVTMGEDPFSSILLSVGTNVGSVLIFRIMPRPDGGYRVLSGSKDVASLSIGKGPVTCLAHMDVKEGKPAEALPDVMARLASGMQIPGGIVACTNDEARFYALSGKFGKKLGAKSYDSPLLGSTYAFLRAGTSSALATVNQKGKVGIYGLPGFKTLSTYSLGLQPMARVAISHMGDAFIPYNPEIESGQVVRIFGTDFVPKEDDLWQLKRRVPARPQISTAHWIAGRQFVKPGDLDKRIAGKRRPKSKRVRHQLVDENEAPMEEAPAGSARPKSGGGIKSWFGGGDTSPKGGTSPNMHRRPQKTWGQTFNEYYESAENTVNGALDEAMESVSSSKSHAQSSAIKGIIGSKFGF